MGEFNSVRKVGNLNEWREENKSQKMKLINKWDKILTNGSECDRI